MSPKRPLTPASTRVNSSAVPYEQCALKHDYPNTSERSRFSRACDRTFRLDVESPSRDKPIAATLLTFEDARHSRLLDFVTWNGQNDLEDPRNWGGWKKGINTGVVLLMCVTHTFAATALLPALPKILDEFGSKDPYLSAFVVSVYILGFMTGPLIFAPLSEILGHAPVYQLCNAIFVAGTCGCAASNSLSMLVGMRFLAGCGGGITYTLAPSTVRYMFVERARRSLIVMAVRFLLYSSPALAPLAGGYIFVDLGWRYTFWIFAILGAFCTVMCAALYEASVPVLLWRKAKRLRKETYNPYLHTPFDDDTSINISARFQTAFILPFRLMRSPSLLVPSSLSAVGIAFLYVLYITLSETSMPLYVWPRTSWGLIYLGVAMSVILVIIIAALGVTFYERLFGKDEDKGPENRIIPLLLYWPLAGIGLILYGFSMYKETHWIGPLFSSGLAGAGILGTVISNEFYIAGVFHDDRASCTSAIHTSILLQTFLGGFIPLFSNKILYYLGMPYTFYLFGAIALTLSTFPGILIFMKRRAGQDIL